MPQLKTGRFPGPGGVESSVRLDAVPLAPPADSANKGWYSAFNQSQRRLAKSFTAPYEAGPRRSVPDGRIEGKIGGGLLVSAPIGWQSWPRPNPGRKADRAAQLVAPPPCQPGCGSHNMRNNLPIHGAVPRLPLGKDPPGVLPMARCSEPTRPPPRLPPPPACRNDLDAHTGGTLKPHPRIVLEILDLAGPARSHRPPDPSRTGWAHSLVRGAGGPSLRALLRNAALEMPLHQERRRYHPRSAAGQAHVQCHRFVHHIHESGWPATHGRHTEAASTPAHLSPSQCTCLLRSERSCG